MEIKIYYRDCYNIIAVFLVVGFFSFVDTKVEYSNFTHAAQTTQKCQVKRRMAERKRNRALTLRRTSLSFIYER